MRLIHEVLIYDEFVDRSGFPDPSCPIDDAEFKIPLLL